MAHTQTRIYIDTTTNPDLGVSTGDVKSVLGELSNDVGNLCQSDKINKWAKYKPIRYYLYDTSTSTKSPYFGLLTEAMRKGPVLDQQNYGIYYGIEVRVPGVDQQMTTWPLLHGTTFTYMKPRGLANNEVFRLRDFEEYHSDARPNPDASLGDEVSAVGFYNYANGITGISVRYVNTNIYGVDLSDILIAVEGTETKETVLSQSYPCILIGKGNTHYITALGYEDDPNHAPRPMYYQNAYVGGTWIADTSKPVYDAGGHSPGAPWTSPQNELFATVVLLRTAKTGGIFLDTAGLQNLATHWFQCTNDILTSKTPIPLPGASGVELSLITWTNGITVSATGVNFDQTLNKIVVSFAWAGTPVGSGSFDADVDTTFTNPSTHIGTSAPTQTVYGSTAFQRIMNVMYDASDFDIVPNPIQPKTYDVTVSVETHEGGVTNTSTQNFTLAL